MTTCERARGRIARTCTASSTAAEEGDVRDSKTKGRGEKEEGWGKEKRIQQLKCFSLRVRICKSTLCSMKDQR